MVQHHKLPDTRNWTILINNSVHAYRKAGVGKDCARQSKLTSLPTFPRVIFNSSATLTLGLTLPTGSINVYKFRLEKQPLKSTWMLSKWTTIVFEELLLTEMQELGKTEQGRRDWNCGHFWFSQQWKNREC